MKNKILAGIVTVSVICIIAGFVFYKFSPATVVSDYDGKNYTQSDIWGRYEELELGVNRYGQVVFKQPERALGRAKELGRDFIYKTKAEFEVPYMPDSYGRICEYATLFLKCREMEMHSAKRKKSLQISWVWCLVCILTVKSGFISKSKGFKESGEPAAKITRGC